MFSKNSFDNVEEDLKTLAKIFQVGFSPGVFPRAHEKEEEVFSIHPREEDNIEKYKNAEVNSETIYELIKTPRNNSIVTTIRMSKKLQQLLKQIAEEQGRSLNYLVNLFCASGVLGFKKAPKEKPTIININLKMNKIEGIESEIDPDVLKIRVKRLEKKVKKLEEEKKTLKEALKEYEEKMNEIEEFHASYNLLKEKFEGMNRVTDLLSKIDDMLAKINMGEKIDANSVKELRYDIGIMKREVEALTQLFGKATPLTGVNGNRAGQVGQNKLV